MYLGIDLGTSGVKAVLIDDDQAVVGSGSAALDVSRPRPGWSEQSPGDWLARVERAVGALRADRVRRHADQAGVLRRGPVPELGEVVLVSDRPVFHLVSEVIGEVRGVLPVDGLVAGGIRRHEIEAARRGRIVIAAGIEIHPLVVVVGVELGQDGRGEQRSQRAGNLGYFLIGRLVVGNCL
jgi:hypothetical protein